MKFAILRTAKIKSRVSLAHALAHNSRDRTPSNADPEKAKFNWECWDSQKAMHKYEACLPEKVRKNAVHAIEVVITLSPEVGRPTSQNFMGGNLLNKYFEEAEKWATKRFGGAGNLLHQAIHGDEMTPHLHLIYMPLKDKKLNAKHYLGGSKFEMQKMQTDFWTEVGASFGLSRGLPKEQTQARHMSLREYYAKVDAEIQKERVQNQVRTIQGQARLEAIKASKSSSKDKGIEQDY